MTPKNETPREASAWNGMCPDGVHGLDYEGQRCDRCAPTPEAPAMVDALDALQADRDMLADMLRGLVFRSGNDDDKRCSWCLRTEEETPRPRCPCVPVRAALANMTKGTP